MNYQKLLAALQERVKQAKKAVKLLDRANGRIETKQTEITAISADAIGPGATLRTRLCKQLEEMEKARVELISAVENILS